jgi:succinate-semialdehyde dehydrogenase/glutarate-semialdehyde dehydrogenase
MYPDVLLYIDAHWRAGATGQTLDVQNPATSEVIGKVSRADEADLEGAAESARRGFANWRRVSPFDRSKIMRAAAERLRSRAGEIARLMTLEQGKPLAESKAEVMSSADLIDWFAEEARRTYGRVIPPRAEGVYQLVLKEPVGPVAAFTPWNFPVSQATRKISAALAAGCSIILKGPEETPASCAELVRAFAEAGVPAGAVSLLFGVPAQISEYLIAHPAIRKISFTGSTAVGKRLASLAGLHMKRVTMELGGHAPAIVFKDADVSSAAKILSSFKFRNAGQVCISPSRILVENEAFDPFVESFVQAAKDLKVGDGMDAATQMGPLANARRVQAVDDLVGDAVRHGAEVRSGGKRIGNKGHFFEPTVLTNVPKIARIMQEEPFGPLAIINRVEGFDEAVAEANRLPYGLAAYAFTSSAKTAAAIAASVESGMMSINHLGLALPEVPFGGVKDSGYGSEGGLEAVESYLNTKFVSQAGV